MTKTYQNDALASAVHDIVSACPDSINGRIVFALDDIDDEHLHRVTEASGGVRAPFLGQFVAAVTEHFAHILIDGGMPPHAAAIVLLTSAKTGIDMALGNEDEDDDEAAVELSDAASPAIQ